MKTITISTENCETYSSISNFFIDYYMTEANGEFVKVYLYLVRLLNTNSNITVAGIADHFNLTENDICRAIKYWISRDVLKLNYDGKGHLKGIVLLPLHAPALDLKIDTDAVSILRLDSREENTSAHYDNVSANTNEIKSRGVVTEFPDNTELTLPTKPRFTAKALEEARNDSDFGDIVYLIETLFGKPVSQTEINTIMYIYDTLKFSIDLFEYLVEYCVEMNKKNCRYMESVAIAWYKDNIKTRQEAKEQAYMTKDVAKIVFKSLGISNRNMTQGEIEFINTWINDLGFSTDIIKKACDTAILAKPGSATFPYVNGILENWHRNNVKSLADIEALEKVHAAKVAKESAAKYKPDNNISSFNDFKQSTSEKSIKEMERLLLREVNGQ